MIDRSRVAEHVGALPRGVAKSLQHLVLLAQLNLDFLPHVENRTIAARAQNLLMQRTLATLAFGPKSCEFFFENGKLGNSFLIDGTLAALAVNANGVRVFWEWNLEKYIDGVSFTSLSNITHVGRV